MSVSIFEEPTRFNLRNIGSLKVCFVYFDICLYMTGLDEIVFRMALAQACRLLNQGQGPEKAAEQACAGSWVVYRERVLNVLLSMQQSDDRPQSR